jgi:hypothetical protein
MDQDGNVGGRNSVEAAAEGLHAFGLAEDDCLGWNLSN